ncbi:RidA family protein [Paremcibacter congregatus]|uniref:RidA family protein n=1 Tax=Paremcibacter congregatus TaxID=2043170 RepID=UPI0030EE06C2|tara:strand:- start:8582 stop:9148 length:567 start_codon:yes stop_codon:yes gene_type:complete
MHRRKFFGLVGLSGLLASTFSGSAAAGSDPASTHGTIDNRLKDLGITLPEAQGPKAAYVTYRKVGNLVYIAGQGPIDSPEHPGLGRVGKDLTVAQGYQAARSTGLNVLAQLKKACDGNLDRVVQCVQVHGIVQCTDDFQESPQVINGATELFRDIFGETGLGARAAVGTNALPFNIACEIMSIFEIRS